MDYTDIALEDEMKKITDGLGRSTVRPKAPGPGTSDALSSAGIDFLGAAKMKSAEPTNTLLDRLAIIRGKVAEFDADIRNDISDFDADLSALHAHLSAKVGTR